jgi:hypothetical protein
METVYCNFYSNGKGTIFSSSVTDYMWFSHIVWFFYLQLCREESGTPTSNQRPSISTSKEVLHSTQLEFRFRSLWRGLTREMPWI